MSDKARPYGLLNADCLEVMRKMPADCIDAIVTDPPYGLSFMGKEWDHGVPGVEFWKEALRVAKPGAHMVAFGGTRTYHRLACAIEDAGWEIRDQIGWVYSSGFPKSMDISKAIDKKLGAERASRGGVGEHEGNIDFGMKNRCPKCGKPFFSANPCTCPRDDLVPITEEAKKWSGWGTCLKPAFEPIVLARKPLDGTAVENVMKHGVGGLNIDECRVPSDEPVVVHSPARATLYDSGHNNMGTWVDNRGRFPANIIHDGSEEVMDAFDNKLTPDVTPIVLARKPLDGTVADNVLKYGVGGLNIEECRVPTTDNLNGGAYSKNGNRGNLAGDERDEKGAGMFAPGKTVGKDFTQPTGRFPANIIHDGSIGSAARFFYCAKASKKEKGKNCERILSWEKDQELTQLLEKSNQLLKDTLEFMMQKQEEIECSMILSGNNTMDAYQKECKSIISMALKVITELKTSFLSLRLNTNDFILDVIKTNEEHGINVAQLAAKLNQLKQDSTKEEILSVLNVVTALFDVLAEIRNCAKVGNQHPTVKPIALMEYLVKLVSPKGAKVMDPFMGSGSTGIAALNLGRNFIGIEKEPEYFNIAKDRIEGAFQKANDVV